MGSNICAAPCRRQQVIAGFIADFYGHKAGLVIELDGGVHQEDEQKESAANRDQVLGEMGLRIVRFRNDDVVSDLSAVVRRIRELILE